MRDPSIHIRRSDFINIVQEYGLSIHDVDDVYRKASKLNIRTRVFVTTKSKGKKKSDRSVESDTNLLEQFNKVYQGCMISNNIKSMTITKSSAQYLTLKEVCFSAKEFSDLNNMGYEEGFKLYIETGIKLLGNKFGIYRLKGYNIKIMEYHQAKTLINNDPNPDGTDDIITSWVQAVKVYFKTSIELENDAQRAHFIHAREDADAMKADYYDWICSAFEKYAYLNSIPSFTQFYGDQAKINYQLYKAKVKKEHNTTEEQSYFKQVTNAKTIKTKASVEETRSREARLRPSV